MITPYPILDLKDPLVQWELDREDERKAYRERLYGGWLDDFVIPPPPERREREIECGCIFDPMLIDGKVKRKCCKCGKVI